MTAQTSFARELGSDQLLFDYPRDRFLLLRDGPASDAGAFVSWIVSPTARCASRCRYCFAAHYDLGDLPLDARGFGRIGRAARDAGFLRCDLSGGEPFLRDDLEAIVDALLESVGVIVTTSAIGVKATRFAAICRRLPIVQISLDGHTDAMNAARGHRVQPVRDAIDAAVSLGVNVRVLTVAHAFNADELPRFAMELQRWGVWEWKVMRVVPTGWDGCLDDARSREVVRSLADSPIPTQLIGFAPSEPRTCVVLEDDLHLHIDRAGVEEDLGAIDPAAPFERLAALQDDQRNHLRYYLTQHSTGGTFERVARTGRADDVWRTHDAFLIRRHRRDDETEDELAMRFAREIEAMQRAGSLAPRLLENFDTTFITEAVDGVAWNVVPVETFVERCCASLATLHRKTPPARVIDSGSRMLEYLCRFAGQPVPRLEGPLRWLHGNANPGNALLRADGTVCWLDWEDTFLGPAEFDFAYLAGHLEVAAGFRADRFLDVARQHDPALVPRMFHELQRIVAAYVIATESRYHRYDTGGAP